MVLKPYYLEDRTNRICTIRGIPIYQLLVIVSFLFKSPSIDQEDINNTTYLKTNQESEFRFPTFYLICLMLIATLGTISNLSSAKYTYTSFTLSKSIYLVLFSDSIVTSVGFIIIQGTVHTY